MLNESFQLSKSTIIGIRRTWSRSIFQQLDFQSTILTRFDLIFKILDPRDPERDVVCAEVVVGRYS